MCHKFCITHCIYSKCKTFDTFCCYYLQWHSLRIAGLRVWECPVFLLLIFLFHNSIRLSYCVIYWLCHWFNHNNSCLFFHRLLWSQVPSLNQKRSLSVWITRCQSPKQCNGINKPDREEMFDCLCTDLIVNLWNKPMFLKLYGSPWVCLLNNSVTAATQGKKEFVTIQLIWDLSYE